MLVVTPNYNRMGEDDERFQQVHVYDDGYLCPADPLEWITTIKFT